MRINNVYNNFAEDWSAFAHIKTFDVVAIIGIGTVLHAQTANETWTLVLVGGSRINTQDREGVQELIKEIEAEPEPPKPNPTIERAMAILEGLQHPAHRPPFVPPPPLDCDDSASEAFARYCFTGEKPEQGDKSEQRTRQFEICKKCGVTGFGIVNDENVCIVGCEETAKQLAAAMDKITKQGKTE